MPGFYKRSHNHYALPAGVQGGNFSAVLLSAQDRAPDKLIQQ